MYHYGCRMHGIYPLLPKSAVSERYTATAVFRGIEAAGDGGFDRGTAGTACGKCKYRAAAGGQCRGQTAVGDERLLCEVGASDQDTDCGTALLLQMERGEQENAESGERMTEEYHMKQLQNLTDMEEELFRIEEYVGMALQYQRLNSNSNDYILKQISLDAVIREVIHKYARIMIRRKIRLHYEKTNVSVISDEKWLAFVLEQLLSNAVKYTPGGELTIEVQEEPQQIWLKIRDTGIGIRSEDIPRVFEKGYTGFNGHEDKRSTGIGLYLCRDALQKLGHTIRIQSEIGEGTVVTVGFYKDTIDVRD